MIAARAIGGSSATIRTHAILPALSGVAPAGVATATRDLRPTEASTLLRALAHPVRYLFLSLGLLITSSLCACGGADGGSDAQSDPVTWHSGVFEASTRFDAKCQSPRSGTDPDGRRWPDVQGAAVDEKNWLRSWIHELYLWYEEVPDIDPATRSVAQYFDILRTSETTDSGQPKDKFHFTFDTDRWLALSQSGVLSGYGLQWITIANRPPREVVVAYTDPDSPATDAGIVRGERVLAVDGADIDVNDQAGVDTLNAGLFPTGEGESHTFTLRQLDGDTVDVTLVTETVTSTPVQNVHVIHSGADDVGYLQFNDHIATAESQLIAAFQTLANQHVDDLVIDIRYNGGGYLAIASELAYMVAGAATAGKTFEQLQFNDKYPHTNPVTNEPLDPVPFADTSLGFSGPPGMPLPTLNLSRVFVLTGPATCSASESIINSLRGIDVEVIQIGSTTCGKPYGFYPADNCGTTYFSIQFRGINAKSFGDYSDGFSPENAVAAPGVALPGCSVLDDFEHALGDVAEARLAEALHYRSAGSCATAPSGFAGRSPKGAHVLSAVDGVMYKSPWHENRILKRPR